MVHCTMLTPGRNTDQTEHRYVYGIYKSHNIDSPTFQILLPPTSYELLTLIVIISFCVFPM